MKRCHLSDIKTREQLKRYCLRNNHRLTEDLFDWTLPIEYEEACNDKLQTDNSFIYRVISALVD
jgi:hypothetical protein